MLLGCSRSFKSRVLANRASKYMYLPKIHVILVVFPYLLAPEGYLKRDFFQFYTFPILATHLHNANISRLLNLFLKFFVWLTILSDTDKSSFWGIFIQAGALRQLSLIQLLFTKTYVNVFILHCKSQIY